MRIKFLTSLLILAFFVCVGSYSSASNDLRMSDDIKQFLTKDESDYPKSFIEPFVNSIRLNALVLRHYDQSTAAINQRLRRQASRGIPEYTQGLEQKVQLHNDAIDMIFKNLSKIPNEFSQEKGNLSQYYSRILTALSIDDQNTLRIHRCLFDKGVHQTEINQIEFYKNNLNLKDQKNLEIAQQHVDRFLDICSKNNGAVNIRQYLDEYRKYHTLLINHQVSREKSSAYEQCQEIEAFPSLPDITIPSTCEQVSQFRVHLERQILQNRQSKQKPLPVERTVSEVNSVTKKKQSPEEWKEQTKDMSTKDTIDHVNSKLKELGVDIPELRELQEQLREAN